MKEDFVGYDLAVKLKEKGFKEKCIANYWEKINEHTPSFLVEDNMKEDVSILDLLSNHNSAEWSPFIDAPTISQVLKWLRKEKNIHIEVWWQTKYTAKNLKGFQFVVTPICENPQSETDLELYCDYETAAIKGIEYVIDNLI